MNSPFTMSSVPRIIWTLPILISTRPSMIPFRRCWTTVRTSLKRTRRRLRVYGSSIEGSWRVSSKRVWTKFKRNSVRLAMLPRNTSMNVPLILARVTFMSRNREWMRPLLYESFENVLESIGVYKHSKCVQASGRARQDVQAKWHQSKSLHFVYCSRSRVDE